MQGRAPVWDYLTSDDEQVGPGRPSDLAASREPRRVPRSQSIARAIAAATRETPSYE
jgi:hypothetical protein